MDAVFVMLRVAVSLAAVLSAIWYLHRRVTRKQGRTKRKANPVSVIGKQGIAAKASVVVVDVEGRRFVLGVTEHSVNVLHSAKNTPAASVEFAAALEQANAAATDEDGEQADAPAPRVPVSAEPLSPVAGSIFAASTWKLALTSVRNGLK